MSAGAGMRQRRPRVLILYCEEGEGHATAARSLARELEEAGAEAITRDALQYGLGRLIPLFSRDAYRLQVRWLRWSYGLEYLLFTRLPPTRALGRRGLALFGARPLRRLIAELEPTLVVSTHPAVTNVLGFLRRRRRVSVPAVATITDFGVHALWAHRGIDAHLVMDERVVPAVERVAGTGTARVVDAIVAPQFRSPRSREDARRALGLPQDGPVALISGGGWGVGDVDRAAEAALAVPGLTVVCLSGRNEPLRRRLEQRFAGNGRIRIVPFTDRMPELVAAADVLVDSTLGVTCLEALSAGCPVIAFGPPPGHSRENARALAALGLAERIRTRAELSERLARLDHQREARLPQDGRTAAAAIMAVRPRVQPAKSRRPVLVGATAALATLVFAGWTFASPTPYPLVVKAFDIGELSSVHTRAQQVGLVVEARQSEIPRLGRVLAHDGMRATFAVTDAPSHAAVSTLVALHDGLLPAVSSGGAVGMLHIRSRLHRLAQELGLQGRFYYLRPESGFTLGDYLSARAAGGRPVTGAVTIDQDGGSAAELQPGMIVVVDAVSGYTRDPVAAVAALLSSRKLRGVPLAELLASANRALPTAGERASASAP